MSGDPGVAYVAARVQASEHMQAWMTFAAQHVYLDTRAGVLALDYRPAIALAPGRITIRTVAAE